MLLFCSVYSIRKNPGAQAGPCPAAYTQNLGTRAVVYTQKSRSPGRALPSSVYAKFRSPGRPLPSCVRKNPGTWGVFCSVAYTQNSGTRAGFCFAAYTVYAKIPEPRQGLVQQRIRKNPEARGGICSVAYTQKSRNLSRLLFCSVYAKIQELEQVSVLQRIQYRRKSGIPGRLLSGSVYAKIQEPRQGLAQQRIPARISIHHKETGKSGSLTRFLMVRINADMKYYSVRSATTGSFLAALREGIMPEKSVSAILMKMRTTATEGGR